MGAASSLCANRTQLEKDMLASLPAWEETAGRPFLVHGVRILDELLGRAEDAERERDAAVGSKRKQPAGAGPGVAPTRAGSAPPTRGTTPTGFAPTAGATRTPALRASTQDGPPSKRPRTVEPPRRTRAPTVGASSSTRPTPGSLLPKPSTGPRTRTTSASGSALPSGGRGVLTHTQSRVVSAGANPTLRSLGAPAPAGAPPVRAPPKRASFKPRPSGETWTPAPGAPLAAGVLPPGAGAGAGRWPGAAVVVAVKEEDED
jgi:protein regulator of cytokinesis 1